MRGYLSWLLIIALSVCSSINSNVSDQFEAGKQEQRTIHTTFEDISGVKRELNINVAENVSAELQDLGWSTEYSQVADGHYYYIRYKKKSLLTFYRDVIVIYQDAGHKIGTFNLEQFDESDYFAGFIRYESRFYVELKNLRTDTIKIVCVDTDKDKAEMIVELSIENEPENIFIYDNSVYCIYPYHQFGYQVEKYDMKGKKLDVFTKPAEGGYFEFLYIVDGKLYYDYVSVQNDGNEKIMFGYWDMKNRKDKQAFCYQADGSTIGNAFWVDVDNIYCLGSYNLYDDSYSYRDTICFYSIPTRGGKMEQIGKGRIYDYAYNEKYYFYIDLKHMLHRCNREMGEDKIISNIEATEVMCTQKGLYVKEYDSWFEDEDGFEWAGDDYSNTLYFMDFEGKNVKKIEEGKRGEME